MKVFISQPMSDKTDEFIKEERKLAIEAIKGSFPDKSIEIIDSFMENAPHEAKPLWFLGKSFEYLSGADLAYFCKDWERYRGCKMEHEAAIQYGIAVMEWGA